MAAKPPIPKDGAEAFNKAVAAFYNWTVEEERDSLIEPHIVQRYSIGAVCDLIRAFDDPMPENVYQFLTWLAARALVRDEAGTEHTIVAGGVRPA